MKNVLSVCGLTKQFGDRVVLKDVSFELRADSINVLLGSNGAGKSTLLRCLLGLLKPNAGSVLLLGRDPQREGRALRELVGFVPDEADASGWMTAPELFHFLRAQYPRWSQAKERELSERLHLPQRTSIRAMSRGEAAKTMLVAALAARPQLLLMDEPFARLAPPARDEVLSAFLEEAPTEGGAVLLATHDLELASRVSDRILLLDERRIAQDVEVEAWIAQHAAKPQLTEQLRALYPPVQECAR